MPRSSLAALLLTILLLTAACGSDKGDEPARLEGFDAERAMTHVRELSGRIGARSAGTPGSQAAADYIVDQFARAGYGVVRNTFTFASDPNRPASLAAAGTTLTVTTAGGSPPGTVSGGAVGLPVPGAAQGRIVVATRGGSSFAEKYAEAAAAGAAGLVIVNSEPGPLVANLGIDARFPVVTASGEDAATLAVAAASGASLTIAVPPPQEVAGANIVARPPDIHNCLYILAANYDTQQDSPGANDNASGVAVLLELARQFYFKSPIPKVCFVAFDARFAAGQGSAAFVDQFTRSSLPAFVINVYRVGSKGDLAAYGDTTLQRDVAAIASRLRIDVANGGPSPQVLTDGQPFRAAGIPLAELSRGGSLSPRDDTPDRVDAAALARAGALAGELAVMMSATVGE